MEPTNPVPPAVASTVPQAPSTTAPAAPSPVPGPFDADAPRTDVSAVPVNDVPARPLDTTAEDYYGVVSERDARIDRLLAGREPRETGAPAALMVAEDHWRDNWHNDAEHRDEFANADSADQMLFLYDVLRRIWQAIGPQ